jgi:hypothetical protein
MQLGRESKRVRDSLVSPQRGDSDNQNLTNKTLLEIQKKIFALQRQIFALESKLEKFGVPRNGAIDYLQAAAADQNLTVTVRRNPWR